MRRMLSPEQLAATIGGGVEELDPSTITTTADGTVNAPEYAVRSAFKLGELYAIVLEVTKPPKTTAFLMSNNTQLRGQYWINGSAPISWSEKNYLDANTNGTIIFLGVPLSS